MRSAEPLTCLREVDVPERGRTVVWDAPGPEGAPTIVLLHGLTLNAELNWSGVITPLAAHYRVIAVDLPGHGQGIRQRPPAGLADCADHVAHVLRAMGVQRAIAVGFSMGGLVAQLLWSRHRELTAGLVLCSTARNLAGTAWERAVALMLPGIVAAATYNPALHPLGADIIGYALLDGVSHPSDRRWALDHMRRTPLLGALSAIQSAAWFTSHCWIGQVDVPTAVVITTRDRVVSARRQRQLADAISNSVVHTIDAGHGVFLDDRKMFSNALLAACASVAGTDSGDDDDDRGGCAS